MRIFQLVFTTLMASVVAEGIFVCTLFYSRHYNPRFVFFQATSSEDIVRRLFFKQLVDIINFHLREFSILKGIIIAQERCIKSKPHTNLQVPTSFYTVTKDLTLCHSITFRVSKSNYGNWQQFFGLPRRILHNL